MSLPGPYARAAPPAYLFIAHPLPLSHISQTPRLQRPHYSRSWKRPRPPLRTRPDPRPLSTVTTTITTACAARMPPPAAPSSPALSRYAPERAAAVVAVARASARARREQASMRAAALHKADASPVTVADFAVQACIVAHLHAAFPSDAFIAEESSRALREDARLLEAVGRAAGMGQEEVLRVIDLCGGEGEGRTWILDPIDGTRGFIARRQYCVALGLLEGGVPRVGVLGCPNLGVEGMEGDGDGVVFHAEEGEGTWMVREGDVESGGEVADGIRGERCVVSGVRKASDALFCESVEKGHSSHELSARVAAILKVDKPPVRMDSQAKYGCMARGDASIFLRFPKGGYIENVWDSAPAVVVIEEAGGKVTDGRGRPLDFSLGRSLDNDDGIVATNGFIHDRVIAAVQQAITEERSK